MFKSNSLACSRIFSSSVVSNLGIFLNLASAQSAWSAFIPFGPFSTTNLTSLEFLTSTTMCCFGESVFIKSVSAFNFPSTYTLNLTRGAGLPATYWSIPTHVSNMSYSVES